MDTQLNLFKSQRYDGDFTLWLQGLDIAKTALIQMGINWEDTIGDLFEYES